MLTGDELNRAVKGMLLRIDVVNQFYIKKIARQIKKIGEMGQSSINTLTFMAEMGEDVNEIKFKLQQATALNEQEMYRIFQQAMQDNFTDPRFSIYLKDNPMSAEGKKRIERLTQLVATQTVGEMQNISNTTAVNDGYKEAIDKAILATSTGVGSYSEQMKQVVQQVAQDGLQVEYESGHRRRLDTAVRQNIIDGTRQLAQEGSLAMGRELGYDAVEISAHGMSAPDHEPVQGRIFLLEEFDKMQNGLDFTDIRGVHYKGFRRPIAQWNCNHIAGAFNSQFSKPRYTEEELQKMYDENHKGCTIDGRHYTRYEASQYMRRLETKVRRLEDEANGAREVGDTGTRLELQKGINALARKYYQFAEQANIRPDSARLDVQGFRMVTKKEEKAWQAEQERKKTQEDTQETP